LKFSNKNSLAKRLTELLNAIKLSKFVFYFQIDIFLVLATKDL